MRRKTPAAPCSHCARPKKAYYRQPHWALAQRAKRRTPAMWGVYHVGCLPFARGSSPRTPAWRAVRACGLSARPLRFLVSSAPSSSGAAAPAPELCGLLRGRVGVRAPLISQPPRATRAPKGGCSSPLPTVGESGRGIRRGLFFCGAGAPQVLSPSASARSSILPGASRAEKGGWAASFLRSARNSVLPLASLSSIARLNAPARFMLTSRYLPTRFARSWGASAP